MNTFCEYFDQGICHSCQLLELSYQDQLAQKEKRLLEKLSISRDLLQTTIPSQLIGFRNKVKLAAGQDPHTQEIHLGLVDKNSKSIDLSCCPGQHPIINNMLRAIKEFIELAQIAIFNPTLNKGELKYIIIYYNPHSQESYLRFILRSKEAQARIIKYLPTLNKILHLKVISLNIQPSPHPILEGEEEIILSERTHLHHLLGNIEFELSPQGFVQTNLDVSTKLYQTAANWIKELKVDKFLELFSGQGAFSFFAAPNVKEALGIEINESAVKSAELSVQKLKLSHLHFKCLDAKEIAEELKTFQPDILLANPPRRGLAESIELINHSGAKNFIYSSCNVETLASDLKRLTHYKIKKLQIFDMFAHTQHFETLVLLERII